MTTARQILDGAFEVLQVKAFDVEPTADEYARGLSVLNQMLGEWANQEELLPYVTMSIDPLVPGKGSYTIGPSGETVVPNRPIKIVAAQLSDNGRVSPPLEVTESLERLWALNARLRTGAPKVIYHLNSSPNSTITVVPPPSAGQTLALGFLANIYQFATLDTDVQLNPGWEFAIISDLAVHLSPRYQIPLTENMVTRAKDAKTAIARTAMSTNKPT